MATRAQSPRTLRAAELRRTNTLAHEARAYESARVCKIECPVNGPSMPTASPGAIARFRRFSLTRSRKATRDARKCASVTEK